jgi:hypothetical protein
MESIKDLEKPWSRFIIALAFAFYELLACGVSEGVIRLC